MTISTYWHIRTGTVRYIGTVWLYRLTDTYGLVYCAIYWDCMNISLDKLINQQEGILAYKVINGTYLLNDFLNHPWRCYRHQIQLSNMCDVRIPLYATTHSQLFVRYRAINTRNGLSGDLRSSSSLCTFKNKL